MVIIRIIVCATIVGAPLTFGVPANAQTDDESGYQSGEVVEQIVVTGSRIKRDTTFNSTAPLAVINAADALQFGALDAASILRQSTSVSGQQVDSSLTGFNVDGGPGAETLALRGLGPERTLVLLDGRRIGAAGNFGGSVFVDLGLIPTFLVERAEILLSGASSIYGADAVAGVVNIITPRDFEGIQLDATYGAADEGDGDEEFYSLQIGGGADRMRFFLGTEFSSRDGVRANQRSFTGPGSRDIRIDENGNVTSVLDGLFDQTIAFGPDCAFAGYTPGQMSGGSTVPNFSCDTDFSRRPWDNPFGELRKHIWTPNTRWAGFASIEFDLESLGDSSFFTQMLISNRKQSAEGRDGQFFPLVPANNNFNPFGASAVPVAFDRQERGDVDDTSVHYQRYVFGLRGNVPVLDALATFDNWTYEMSAGYTRSEGENTFDIVRNDRLTNSINNCPNSSQNLFSGSAPACVPVNLFSHEFLTTGSLGNARDYLVARVLNATTVTQYAYELGATGDLFDVPAGPVGAFIGASYREDAIHSNVDRNLEEANAWGRGAEGDTIGDTNLREIYVEIDVPLLAGRRFAEEVGVNASYRVTDDKFFGSEDTWRITGHWDFTDWLRLRTTAGTSFRAPNLKELFIADQRGFASAFIDPCIPPAGEDDRSQIIIDNCISEGVDPNVLGADGAPGVPVVSGGADDLRPETSDSWSIGFVFSQPWTDRFDFQVSADLTDLEIKDAVAEPSAGFILNQCYTSINFSDPLCERVTRNTAAAPDLRFLSEVDQSVANIEIENYRDLSFSTLFSTDFEIGGREMSLTWNTDFMKMLELREGLFIETADDFVGSIGTPEWQIQSAERLSFGNWSISHRGSYFSSTELTPMQVQNDGIDDVEVHWIGNFHSHAFSVSYETDRWRAFLTVENAFSAKPDLIDDEAFGENSVNNMPIGVYPADAILGRAVILSVRMAL